MCWNKLRQAISCELSEAFQRNERGTVWCDLQATLFSFYFPGSDIWNPHQWNPQFCRSFQSTIIIRLICFHFKGFNQKRNSLIPFRLCVVTLETNEGMFISTFLVTAGMKMKLWNSWLREVQHLMTFCWHCVSKCHRTSHLKTATKINHLFKRCSNISHI